MKLKIKYPNDMGDAILSVICGILFVTLLYISLFLVIE